MEDMLVKNGTLADAEKTLKADILIKNGKINRISPDIDPQETLASGGRVIDATGLLVLPGLIDAHTHYHLVSRGTVTADSFEEGSRLAAFGGVTTVVDFADHGRGMSLKESTGARIEEMAPGMAIDWTLHQGVYGHGYGSDIPQQLEELAETGIKTLKIFTTYRETGYLLDDRKKLSELFKTAGRLGFLVTAHCEYNPMIEQISAGWTGGFEPPAHADLRPAEAEARAIELYGGAALEQGCPFYVVHCSSEAGLNAIRKLRKQGGTVYAETTPTYLFLDRSRLEGKDGALYVMTPPLRTSRDCAALREALENGEFDVVATDHCAFTREQKLANPDVRSTYPGIPGTEELFLLLNTFRVSGTAGRSGFTLNDLVRVISTNPAKLFGLYPEKGSLEENTDADLILVDPDAECVLEDSSVHTAAGFTPYRGFRVKGRVRETILRGRVIMENDGNNGRYCGRAGEGRFLVQR